MPTETAVSPRDALKRDLDSLIKRGLEVLKKTTPDGNPGVTRLDYEPWYTSARSAVAQLVPERLLDFESAYRARGAAKLSIATYGIADYFKRLHTAGMNAKTPVSLYMSQFEVQLGILAAAKESLDSRLRDIAATIRAEILSDDISAAKELHQGGHLRAAGAVAGVALEAHLKSICKLRSVVVKNNATISELNDALKTAGAYDVPTWRLIQRLGDVRNLCSHKKDRDPRSDEVEDLIVGASKVTAEVA